MSHSVPGTQLYSEVKRASDSFLGIPSQCFVAKKASVGMPPGKPRDQYTANLAMKINVKLEGINWYIRPSPKAPWQSQPYMVIGGLPPYLHARPLKPKTSLLPGTWPELLCIRVPDLPGQNPQVNPVVAKQL